MDDDDDDDDVVFNVFVFFVSVDDGRGNGG